MRVTIAAIVTGIWATAYTVSIFNPHYEPNPAITSVELLVVAYLFVTERQKRNGR